MSTRGVHFVIPEGTTSIDEGSLEAWGVDKETLQTVTIPISVKSIGDCAFDGCSALVGVTIPISVKSIGECAFNGCSALVEVAIPNSVKLIGEGAFQGCSALVEVKIPTSVESIGDGAFYLCSALAEVTIPTSVKSVGEYAFSRCHAGLTFYTTLVHQLPGTAGCCTVRCVDPIEHTHGTPGPRTLFDGSGIVQPVQLQTLGGDEYLVYGCWGKDPVAHPDFKQLAAEQHPEALGELGSWGVLLHNTDVATHTLDLAAVGDMLVRGEFDLDEPVLVIWTGVENAEGSNKRSDESAAAAGVEKKSEC